MARMHLFGPDGMLGSALMHVLAPLHAVTPIPRARFDIAAADWSALDAAGQDYVLNAAGLIPHRAAPSAESWVVNAVFPHALAAACDRAGARLIHFSTDCVFDGSQGPADEAVIPRATDGYGRGKRAGEPPGALTLRTSIIGPERRHGTGLLCWALREAAPGGYVDHLWNGVTTVALAHAVARVVADGLFAPGVRHVHAEDTTKHDLLALIRRRFGRAPPRPMPGPAPRDTRLRTRHPDFLAALRLPPFDEQVAALPALATPRGLWPVP